ncbi:MAG: 4-(cytidine 5'-diphospho)-2-C-methyl-D-erythritol kinase [Planctomycetota bacterium]
MAETASTASTQGVTVRAPAKVNVSLDLLGKRCDGYHELRTTMVTLGVCDTVRLSSRDDASVKLRLLGAAPLVTGVPTDDTNLVIRAVKALRYDTNVTRGATIDLVKRTPSQAGLGGGSSDAAAALVAGNRVWGLGLSTDRLAEIGATLGSDIPFFVHAISDRRCRAALATGRGERVTPLAGVAATPCVVVKPTRGLSTSAVYAAVEPRDLTPDSDSSAAIAALGSGRPSALAAAVRNGLAAAARRVAPWIDDVLRGLRDLGCLAASLSGSGSACFAVAASHRHARRVAATLRARGHGWAIATRFG